VVNLAVHAFTDVDRQDRPRDWADLLDRISDEPFYGALKRRIAELLHASRSGRYLDAGAGTGKAAAALAGSGADVVALDFSATMARAARDRGLRGVVQADAQRLPLASATFTGAWADRVLQHVADPRRAARELVRVLAPGGRLVLCDPDYDTQVLDIADQDLARQVLRFRADRLLRNGAYAHRHGGLLTDLGLVDVAVEAHTLVVRDPTAVDNVLGLRSWAGTAASRGELAACDAHRFEAAFDEAVARGHFTYAVTFFVTSGTVARA
jgi:SAM-dependent methyltransferase